MYKLKKITAKAVAIMLSAVVLTSCGGSGTPRQITDLEKNDARGGVKEISTEYSKLVFNQQGYIIESYEKKSGEMKIITKNTYAEDGVTLVSIETFNYKWNGEVESEVEQIDALKEIEDQKLKDAERGIVKTYNSDGNLIKRVRTKVRKKENVRPDVKNLIKNVEFDSDGNMIQSQSIWENKYEGNKLIETIYTRKSIRTKRTESEYRLSSYSLTKFQYNKQGDVLTEIEFDEDGKEVSNNTFTYKYDEKNNWVEKTDSSIYQKLTDKREILY